MSAAEAGLRAQVEELTARLDEMTCLVRVSDLLQRTDLDLEAKLDLVPALIAETLHASSSVLLELGERRYAHDWERRQEAIVRAAVLVSGRAAGTLAIARWADPMGQRTTSGERALVAAIASRIAAQLEQQLAEAERSALEDQARQSQKMDAIARLAGGIAHDFNNLLTSIKGLTSLALRELEPGHPIRPDLEEIGKAAQRAAGLTRQLLVFSRRQTLSLVLVDLNAVVAGIESMLRRVVGEQVELRASYGHGLRPVLADPGSLEQIVMNLVVNAQDALRGRGIIQLETRHESVGDEPGPVPPGEYAVLSVRDTGVGIPPEHIDKVFEPFFTTKPAGDAQGLGLANVFGVVSQSGGHVRVDSRPGAGSTFRVYLPFAAATQSADEAPSDAAILSGSETVLVAEDDASVRRLVNRILGGAGYRVLEAENALQALDVIRDESGAIDLLLTDIVMPDASGAELSATVRRHWPGVRVMHMSGYTDDPVAGEAANPDGAWLAKPFSPDVLLAKVRRMLDREPKTLADR